MLRNNLLKRINLLYVEDDPMIRSIFEKRLKKRVRKLFVGENGAKGLELFEKESIDIVLTDINMPIMNGLEMIEKIRKQNPKIPIIIMSAHQESHYLLDAIHLNVTGYLTKPIDSGQLDETLQMQAKTILFEKECAQQYAVLQKIIDTDPNMIIIRDREQIHYANKTFLEFFASHDLENFYTIHRSLTSTFVKNKNYLHSGLCAPGESFIDLLLRTPHHERIVSMLDIRSFTPKTFLIKISLLDEVQETYLWNFVDITDMTLEKIRMEDIAYHDKLTGAYNRQKMDEVIHYEMLQQKRYHTPLSFAILDIDHFKRVNDTFGHRVGDEILKQFARTIEQNMRKSDTFARWGGEEFVILLTQTDLSQARIALEKLRKVIEETIHPLAGRVTASFGVTQIDETDTFDEVYNRADIALYEAKEKGRNRVEISISAHCTI